MTSRCVPDAKFLLVLLVLFNVLAFPAAAQIAGPPASLREGPFTVERLKANLEAAKLDGSLDDAEKEGATKRLEEAIANLEAVDAFTAQAEEVKNTVAQGPVEAAAIRDELEARRAGMKPEVAGESTELPPDAGAAVIDARLAAERARLSDLSRQVRDLEGQLAELESRPGANRDRIVAVTRTLSEAQGDFAKWNGQGAETSRARADFARDQTRIRALRAELAMLEQESLSFDARRELLQARRDLAASDVGLARGRIAELESRSSALVSERIGLAERLIGDLGLEDVSNDPDLRGLVEESRALADRNQALLGRIAAADAARNEADDDLDRLRRDALHIRSQVEIGGLEESFSEILVELRRNLPTQQSLRGKIAERRLAISESRLEAFRTERELASLASPEGQVEELLDLLRTKGVSEEELAEMRPELGEFVANRAKLRRDWIDGNRRLASVLGEIDLITAEALGVATELRDFLGERLVWAASSPPLGKNAFTGMRTAFLALAGPAALAEYGRAVARIDPGKWIVASFLTLALLVPRRRLRRRLAASAARTRRISVDGIGNTIEVLAISLWMALPLPILLGFFGWIFRTDPRGSTATYALGEGLLAPALLLLVLRFSAVLCWPGGVAEAHFRWKRGVLDPLHRSLMALIFLYLPAHFVLAIWWNNGEDLSAFQGPGRIVFIVAMIAVAMILRRFFRKNGEDVFRLGAPGSAVLKARRIWIVCLLLLPPVFAVLAASGYFLTAVALSYLMQKTVFVIFGAVLAYAFLTRWAALKGRRMALAAAIAQREAKRAAQESSAGADPSAEDDTAVRDETVVLIEEDEPVDWAVVGEQTRHLIRAFVTLTALFGCWLAWSEALPALKYLDSWNLVGEISASDVIWLALIGVITMIVFQNLPGLLELGFLSAFELESGVRNAVVTLFQYLVIAIGAVAASRMIGLDWSQFGWIAAALSVGLGFGLQEVVANFVSGLILLFERPIRVGDIVTVGGVDGVVTKIRIRATTITNWDKKEFIVPNKEFVTGTIMNWTLSSQVTRLVFPVGIAYGSDIEKARGILLEIAESQPEILGDPKPAAIFEGFGDSSLNFTLRCFLASTDQRLEMTHRVNTLIHDRFAAAGIGIPYPHREVLVRTVGEVGAEAASAAFGDGEAPRKG